MIISIKLKEEEVLELWCTWIKEYPVSSTQTQFHLPVLSSLSAELSEPAAPGTDKVKLILTSITPSFRQTAWSGTPATAIEKATPERSFTVPDLQKNP